MNDLSDISMGKQKEEAKATQERTNRIQTILHLYEDNKDPMECLSSIAMLYMSSE